MVGVKLENVIVVVKLVIVDGRFYRCLFCNVLCEVYFDVFFDDFKLGGEFYEIVVKIYGFLEEGFSYFFFVYELVCVFDVERNLLVVVKYKVDVRYFFDIKFFVCFFFVNVL